MATRCGKSATDYTTGDHAQNKSITSGLAPAQKRFMIDEKASTPSASARMKKMAESFGLTFSNKKHFNAKGPTDQIDSLSGWLSNAQVEERSCW